MGIVLRCTGGPCAGETITIDSELLFGREEPDPGRLGGDERLSRRHARVFLDESGRAVVEDLGSTNGTWINQQQLSEARVCANGDVLRVGRSTFEIELPIGSAPTTFDTEAGALQRTVADAAAPTPVVVVAEGPKQGEEIPLGEELLIGRGFGEPGALGGDRRLSRHHARIARGPGGVFFIEDTGSSNGTMVNRVAIRHVQPLKDGDEIAVGSSKLEPRGLPRAPVTDEPEHVDDQAAASPAPPPPAAAMPAAAIPAPAVGVPSSGQFVPQGAASGRISTRRGRLVGVFAAVFAAAAAISVAAVALLGPLGTRSCPSGFICQPPLTAPPLHAMSVFTGALGWRVEYDPHSTVVSRASAGTNSLDLRESGTYDQRIGASANSKLIVVVIRGYRSSEMSPRSAVQSLLGPAQSNLVGAVSAPSSDQFFVRPVLGFHPAVGEAIEGDIRTPQGPGQLVKFAVLSAESGGVTIAMGLLYPIQRGQTQVSNPDTALDSFGDQILGTVRFPNDGAT